VPRYIHRPLALSAVNAKSFGFHPVVIPVSYTFPDGVLVPKGQLILVIDTDVPGKPPTDDRGVLNTEVHLTIQWSAS
jgi:hypothetical protein